MDLGKNSALIAGSGGLLVAAGTFAYAYNRTASLGKQVDDLEQTVKAEQKKLEELAKGDDIVAIRNAIGTMQTNLGKFKFKTVKRQLERLEDDLADQQDVSAQLQDRFDKLISLLDAKGEIDVKALAPAATPVTAPVGLGAARGGRREEHKRGGGRRGGRRRSRSRSRSRDRGGSDDDDD